LIIGLFCLGFLATTFITHRSVYAAVTLVYFRAIGQQGSVVLDWETATEIDHAGFIVNRSQQQSSNYQRISEFIVAKGDPLLGARYIYTDTNVVIGEGYWYKLESIDIRQNSDFYEPPVFIIPGTSTPATATTSGQPTATKTATPPFALTRTPTQTIRSGSPISTQSFQGLNQSTASVIGSSPGQLPIEGDTTTFDSVETLSSSSSPTDRLGTISTATSTLIPLPEITLKFPDAAIAENQLPTPPSIPSFVDRIVGFSPNQLLFFTLILFVWLFLGGWFYFTLRQVKQ